VLDWLEERCAVPVLAVRGNGDDGGGGRPRCPEDPRLKPVQVAHADGLRIGMVHDATLPEWPPHRTLESIMEHHFSGRVDVLVHGDTHVAEIEEMRGVLLVNPGSPTRATSRADSARSRSSKSKAAPSARGSTISRRAARSNLHPLTSPR